MATHEIIIKRDPSVGGISTEGVSPPPAQNGIATQKSSSVTQSQIGGMLKASATKVAVQAIQSVSQTYMANKTTEINVLSGSTQYAQRQAAINSVASAGINIATGAIQSGSILAALGMSGGMAGAIALGTSLLGTLLSTLTEIEQKRNELQIKRAAETQELDYLNSRAGPFYNGSR